MKLSAKRLFLRDLPPNLTEEDINQKFSKFGEVTAIEVKERKNLTLKNKFHAYAFININVDNNKLQECFENFNKNKWKGNHVEIQIAKQSFLEKLKEERKSENFSKLHDDTETFNNFVMEPFNKKQSSYTASNVSVEVELPLKRKRLASDSEKSDNEDIQLMKKNKKIQSIESKNLEIVSNGYVDTKINELSKIAEEKRLKSISEMKKSYRKQKDAIKIALMNVDTNSCKKIVFNEDDDIEQHETESNVIKDTRNKQYDLNSDKKGLFGEDDDDEHNYNFEVKEQFLGKKGKKLMELQTKFKSDKRFTMDERFLEDNEESSTDELQEKNHEKLKTDYSETENDILITTEEKRKELSILEDVLGKKFVTTGQETERKKNPKSVSMMRYDPSKPEHSKFIIKQNDIIKEKSQKRKDNQYGNINIEMEKPIVSKDIFYEVEDNLKETLQENKSFSLLSMFGTHQHTDDEKQPDDIVHDNQIKETREMVNVKEKNPFRYDSSDESDGEEEIITADSKPDEMEGKTTEQNVSLGPTRLWTEPLFFKADDYRLQEGIDFVRRFELDDKSEFKQIRRNIKEIVRAKVRNNQRKNRPFKKKIGGRKMVKLRKAMKNR